MRVFLCAVLTVWATVSFADVPRPETLDDTLNIMADAYRDTGLFESVTVDAQDQSVSLTREGDSAYTSYPDNLHLILQGAESDAERQGLLDDFIAAMVEQATRSSEEVPDASLIVPLVRVQDFAAEAGDMGPVSDPFVGDMRIFYAFDYPSSFAYVTQESLDDLGLDPADLAAVAQENFDARGWAPELQGDGIWMLTFDGNFEATFLLNDAMWRGFDEQLGTILMMALARDLILFTDADIEGAEAEMHRIADENFDQLSYQLSKRLYQWTDAGWVER